MGMLIDADKLIELMIRDRDYAGENGFMDMFYERQHLIGVINKQHIAYDVDKVVEQLENERKFWENAYDSNLGKAKARSYVHAIEIVKGGGLDA